MDWSILIGAGSALGLSGAIRLIVHKWVNKKKDEMDTEAASIVNKEKLFTMFSDINEKLAAELSDMTQQLIGSHSKTAEIVNQRIKLTMENADLKTQNELLLKENEQLKKSLGELEAKLAKMEKQIKELELRTKS